MIKRLFFILVVLAIALLVFRGSMTGNVILENNASECRNLAENNAYFLQSDIIADDNCFNITGDNVVLDGKGHTINFIKSGEGAAIFVNGENFEIRNISINVATGVGKDGIRIINSGTGIVHNVDVLIKSDDSYAFYFELNNDLNISENNLTVYGTGSKGIGLFDCFGNYFYGNNIKTYGERGYGLQLYSSENNLFIFDRIFTYGAYASGVTLDNSKNNVFVTENINTIDAYALEFGNGDVNQEVFDSRFISEKNKGVLFEPESYGILNLTNTSLTDVEFSGNNNVSVYKNWYLETRVYRNITGVSDVNFSFADGLGKITKTKSDDAGNVFLILPELLLCRAKTQNLSNYTASLSYGNISKHFFINLNNNYYRDIDIENLSFLDSEKKLEMAIVSPLPRDYFGRSINISVRTNIEASCRYNLNDNSNITLAYREGYYFAEQTGLKSGRYVLSVFCKADEKEIEQKVNFSIGTGDFTVIAVFPQHGERFEREEKEYTFLVEDSDELKECFLFIDGVKVKSISSGLSVEKENKIVYDALPGEHESYIKCIDSKGRIGESDIIIFSILPKYVRSGANETVKNDSGKIENTKKGLPISFVVFLIVLISVLLLVVLWIMLGNRKQESMLEENDQSNFQEQNLENFR